MSAYRGRFAPSPTGDLHLGGASTALVAWLAARSCQGTLVMRIEDIDAPRVREGSEQRILEDLMWLGLDWDEGPHSKGPTAPYRQSERTDLYVAALQLLQSQHRAFECDCSRKEVAQVASAPAPGEEGPIYPGTCRNRQVHAFRRPPAWRFAVPPNHEVHFVDRVHGPQRVDVACETGDFVLRRGDGVFSYQLAVAVDDIAQGITQVVRGTDLLSSTARQMLLIQSLGATPPQYAHPPLVVGVDGQKLAKRARGVPIRDHRAAGVAPEVVVAFLARGLGLAESGEDRLRPVDLVPRFSWTRISRGPIRLDPTDLAP